MVYHNSRQLERGSMLEFVLRDAAKHEATLLDLPWPYFLVAPPSGLVMILAQIDGRLRFYGFDCVDSWLHIFLGVLCSIRPVAKLFWSHCFFAVKEFERCKLCCPRLYFYCATR